MESKEHLNDFFTKIGGFPYNNECISFRSGPSYLITIKGPHVAFNLI